MKSIKQIYVIPKDMKILIRYSDNSSEEIFEKSDGSGTKSTVSGILAATYHF